ncbi:hypothetical protein LCGC14_1587560, partial [marine sediment metagenome]
AGAARRGARGRSVSAGDGNHCATCGGPLVFTDNADLEMCLGCEMLMHCGSCAERHATGCRNMPRRDAGKLAAWSAGAQGWEVPGG